MNVLESEALFGGPTLPVFVRVGELDGKIYLELGDPTWRAVEVEAQGWRVVACPPVKFVRRLGMLPLPIPEPGGCIEGLRPFLNLPEDEGGEKAWRLLVSWLVAAILTGINPVAANQDLINRQVLIELRDFASNDEREEEKIIYQRFEKARPSLLGALLTRVSVALSRVDRLKIRGLPRMADFAKCGAAAEPAWGWPEGSFLAAYAENEAGQAAASVEADLVASTLVEFMRGREFWESTPTELHKALTTLVPEEKRKLKAGKYRR